MKSEELFEVLNDIDENEIVKAQEYRAVKKTSLLRWILPAACAAAILIIAAVSPLVSKKFSEDPAADKPTPAGTSDLSVKDGDSSGNTEAAAQITPADTPVITGEYSLPENMSAVMPAYPEPVAAGMEASAFMESDAHWNWWDDYRTKMSSSFGLQSGMEHYYLTMMDQLLIADDENTVISPLNTYIAFAMLAELSDGNTRRQLLDLLGAPDIETLRADVSTLWNGNYVDTPILKSILANSLWLNDTVNYKAAALDTLAKDYYASSFYGDPSTPEMSEALRNWTDQNTGGILGEYVKDMELDPSTVLSIVSTIYYKAMWYDEFNASENTRESFHGTMGDTAVDMMHRSDINEVYRTDAFTAIHLGLNDSGSMYFFLPKEGVDVNSLLTDPDTIKATRTEYMTDDENASTAMVNMSIPKFSISNNSDLTQALKNCGISDIFDPLSSDFSPLTDDRNELYVSKAEHTALVEIDEQGVSGAAFTRVDLSGGAMLPEEEIDLVLDRPFMFMICGRDGSILFAGIVRNIT